MIESKQTSQKKDRDDVCVLPEETRWQSEKNVSDENNLSQGIYCDKSDEKSSFFSSQSQTTEYVSKVGSLSLSLCSNMKYSNELWEIV